jgi:hypothetical protein
MGLSRLTPALSKGEGVKKGTKLTASFFKVLSFGEDLGEATNVLIKR